MDEKSITLHLTIYSQNQVMMLMTNTVIKIKII